jgi:LPS sulfotransferase NodH
MDEAYRAWVLQPTLPPAAAEPRLAWFLCGIQRSGTWSVAGLLDSTGVAGRSHEWFSERTGEANRRTWGVDSDAAYLSCVKRAGTTPNGVFACKLMWGEALERMGEPASFAPEQFFVWLRRDHEAVGVSWARAAQTGFFHAWDPPPKGEPRFVRQEIEGLAGLARERDAAWRRWFADRAIEPLELWYDDVVADPDAASARVLAYLGLSKVAARVRTEPMPPSDWLERYTRE